TVLPIINSFLLARGQAASSTPVHSSGAGYEACTHEDCLTQIGGHTIRAGHHTRMQTDASGHTHRQVTRSNNKTFRGEIGAASAHTVGRA
ncbi:MAG: hypothetical protein ACPIOQ_01525, partial [Promethearchaeia archaeon]